MRSWPGARLSRPIFFALAFAAALFASTPAGAAVTYTYDSLGRLVRVDYATGNYIVYQYDVAGNRMAVGNVSTNAGPTAASDSVTLNQNSTLTFDPRTNDVDPDYDPLTISAKTNGAHGTVAINSGTSLTYTPMTGYHGADSFSYTIDDGAGHASTATVNTTIVNQPPVAVADSIYSAAGAAVTFDPRSNDSDPESDGLTITAKADGAHGTVTINSGTSLTYAPTSGFVGTDHLTYTISDGQGNSATGAVTATVGSVPVANDDVWALNVDYTGTPVTPSGDFDPTTNDSDADGDSLTIMAVSTPTHGSAAIVDAHTVHYTYGSALSGDQSRSATFNYTVSDGHGNTATATIEVDITVTDTIH